MAALANKANPSMKSIFHRCIPEAFDKLISKGWFFITAFTSLLPKPYEKTNFSRKITKFVRRNTLLENVTISGVMELKSRLCQYMTTFEKMALLSLFPAAFVKS